MLITYMYMPTDMYYYILDLSPLFLGCYLRAGVKYTSSSTITSTSIFIFHFTSTRTSTSTMIFYYQVQVQIQVH